MRRWCPWRVAEVCQRCCRRLFPLPCFARPKAWVMLAFGCPFSGKSRPAFRTDRSGGSAQTRPRWRPASRHCRQAHRHHHCGGGSTGSLDHAGGGQCGGEERGGLPPLDLLHLVGLGAAGRDDLHAGALGLADERAGQWRGDRDLALLRVGLGFADDLPHLFL